MPGPREPRYLAGRRIRTIMFWVPQPGCVVVAVDARLVPDPDRILDGFPDELDALRASIG